MNFFHLFFSYCLCMSLLSSPLWGSYKQRHLSYEGGSLFEKENLNPKKSGKSNSANLFKRKSSQTKHFPSKHNSFDLFPSTSPDSNDDSVNSLETPLSQQPLQQPLQHPLPNILELSELGYSEEEESIKDTFFTTPENTDNTLFPTLQRIDLNSTEEGDSTEESPFWPQKNKQLLATHRPLLLKTPQNIQCEIDNILTKENYTSSLLNAQEVLFIKFVFHLFNVKSFKEIEKEFFSKIPEASFEEGETRKINQNFFKEEREARTAELAQKLTEAPRFLQEIKDILDNSLCFIPIQWNVYAAFIEKKPLPLLFQTPLRFETERLMPRSLFLPPSPTSSTVYLEFLANTGVRFYEIMGKAFMTVEKENIQKCDSLLKKCNHLNKKSIQTNLDKSIIASGHKKREMFSQNEDFDKSLRNSIVEW